MAGWQQPDEPDQSQRISLLPSSHPLRIFICILFTYPCSHWSAGVGLAARPTQCTFSHKADWILIQAFKEAWSAGGRPPTPRRPCASLSNANTCTPGRLTSSNVPNQKLTTRALEVPVARPQPTLPRNLLLTKSVHGVLPAPIAMTRQKSVGPKKCPHLHCFILFVLLLIALCH
jgi:hypothetical protein